MPRPDADFIRAHTASLTLEDGGEIIVRPIQPSDKSALAEGLRRLSPESRYLRFFTSVDRFSSRELAYLTEIDYDDHFAWVAVKRTLGPAGEPEGIGVARYIRIEDDPTVAEAAVAVIDGWQGRGVGRALLGLLMDTASAHGVTTFRASVIRRNSTLVDRLRRESVRMSDHGEMVEFDIDLDSRSARAAVRRVLRLMTGSHAD